jgi:gliding motility-associated-like protein
MNTDSKLTLLKRQYLIVTILLCFSIGCFWNPLKAQCPTIDLNISTLPSICKTSVLDTVHLNANPLGGLGNGTFTWSGNATQPIGEFYPHLADLGANIIYLQYVEDTCIYVDSFIIEVIDAPEANFSLESPFCISDTSSIIYLGNASDTATFNWDFDGGTVVSGSGSGPFELLWPDTGSFIVQLQVTENGCTSSKHIDTLCVNDTLNTPIIECVEGESAINFGWWAGPLANDYELILNGVSIGTQTDRQYTVTNLNTGDSVNITVIASGQTVCGSTTASFSCKTKNCPPLEIIIDQVPDICRDTLSNPISLNFFTESTGYFIWTGVGITRPRFFNPLLANLGPNRFTLSFFNHNCLYTEQLTINVFDTPSSDFFVDSSICVSDTSAITYLGTASDTATFNWDFDGGTIVSGSGSGPFEVHWPDTGSFIVNLQVIENGCISPIYEDTIQVIQDLKPPNVFCYQGEESIGFQWGVDPLVEEYEILINGQSVGTQSGTRYTVTGLTYGDSVNITVIASGPTECSPSITSYSCKTKDCPPPGETTILPVPDICRDTLPDSLLLWPTGYSGVLYWTGIGIDYSGFLYPKYANLGPNIYTLHTFRNNCLYTDQITINVFDTPSSDFSVDSSICVPDTATITYLGTASDTANFNWYFDGGTIVSGNGKGPYEIQWHNPGTYNVSLSVEENGCTSPVTTIPVQVFPQLAAPVLNCLTSNSSEVIIGWDPVLGATGYSVTLLNGVAGTFDQNALTYTASNLSPGDSVSIQVTATNATSCGSSSSSITCFGPCPNLTVNIDSIGPFCSEAINQPVPLTATTGDNTGNYFWSGPGVDSATMTFNPNDANLPSGEYTIEAVYEKNNCIYNGSVQVEIFQTPEADFSLTDTICITENNIITYTGNAGPNATYDWDFDGGIVVSGSGVGPYEVLWPGSGTFEVGLTVEENGCSSAQFVVPLQVDDTLHRPANYLFCNTDSISNISFEWNLVPNATEHNLVVLNGSKGEFVSSNLYLVDSLNRGDRVTIELMAVGPGVCGPIRDTITCQIPLCDTLDINFENIGPFCSGQTMGPVELNAQTGDNTGTYYWSGPGVDSASMTFNPIDSNLLPGIYTIEAVYEKNYCIYNAAFQVELFQTPEANFSLTDTICITENNIITYTGNAGPNATFNWDFDGGMVISGSGVGPYEIQWPDAGSYQIGLVVEEAGCISDTTTKTVTVDPELAAPQIDCSSTPNSIQISWDPIAGATHYEVFIDGISQGIQTDNSFSLTGLSPNQDVQITVQVFGNTACGSKGSSISCRTRSCPFVTLEMPSIGPFCLNEVQPFDLEVNINGSSGTGMGIWSGPAVSPQGRLNPLNAGPGVHVLYYTYTEDGCAFRDSLSFENFRSPDANAGPDKEIGCSPTIVRLGSDLTPDTLIMEWTFNGTPIGNTRFIDVNQLGTYTLTVTDPFTGCTNADFVQVDTFISNLNFNVIVRNPTCPEDTLTFLKIGRPFNGTSPFLYSINGGAFSSQTDYFNLMPGNYTILVEDANGCEKEKSYTIEEADSSWVEISITKGENPFSLGDDLELTATTNLFSRLTDVYWTPSEQFINCDIIGFQNCLSAGITPQGPTLYTVTVEAGLCKASDSIFIDQKPFDYSIYVPSAFSPRNKDGINDHFLIYADSKFVPKIKVFTIFDIWGNQIFEAKNFAPDLIETSVHAWDGTFKGKPMNSGVFMYYIEAEFFDGTIRIFVGDVTVL